MGDIPGGSLSIGSCDWVVRGEADHAVNREGLCASVCAGVCDIGICVRDTSIGYSRFVKQVG